MQAAYYERNQTLRIGENAPVTPGPGEVRIAVAYGGICGTDLGIYHGKMDWRTGESRILGHEISGVVAETGGEVTHVRPGDRVTVMPLDPCGECPACQAGHSHICQNLKFIGIDTTGGFQRSWTVPGHAVLPLPEGLALRTAALIEPLAVACHDVRLGETVPGEYAVVLGGGPIGALIALVAREAGARVLVSEINTYRLQAMRDLGLEAVNPGDIDLLKKVEEETSGAGADVVFEVTGHPSAVETMTQLPRTRGRIVVVGISAQPVKVDLFRFFWRELKLRGVRVYEREDFEQAIATAAAGSLPLDRLISAVHPLADIKKGFEEMDAGGEVMKVLIQCSEEAMEG